MKIKEAIEVINGSTITVLAEESNGFLHMYRRGFEVCANWFLEMPIDATNWDSICSDWDCLSNIEPQDLARVMDVVQRLICTPVNKRFPEKKYVLSAIRCAEGPVPIKQYVNAINVSTNNVEFHFGFDDEKADAMEFTQKKLDSLSDFFPKAAIDAMKEPVEDKDE